MQTRLMKNDIKYSYGPYNKVKGSKQWIRLSEGCPHNCPWCYEPIEEKIFEIPRICRNDVGIMDMNLLCKPNAIDILRELPVKLNNKIIRYEFICGIDYRFLLPNIALEIRKHNVKRIRIAWDWFYKDMYRIFDAINMLKDVGYKSKDIMIFIICNHNISYIENCKKLDICKVWNVLVADCYYDNQVKIFNKFISNTWSKKEAILFRSKCRKHNQLVNFGIDPEINRC